MGRIEKSYKGCLNKKHTNNHISLICLDQTC